VSTERVAAPFGPDPSRSVRASITQGSMERVFTILLAAAAVGFAVVDAPSVLGQLRYLDPLWAPVMVSVLALAIIATGVAAFVQRLAQPTHIVIALVVLVALVTWPITVHTPIPSDDKPWPWWFCNVGTITASLGFATWRATVYNALVPAVYAMIRLTPEAGGVGLRAALLDSAYAAILGVTALVLIVALRRAAAAVDSAQSTAVRRYADAIREHATEVERVRVDAIVHDSVLTTLLSAARADTPAAQTLAARMARNAIDHLAAAADAPDDERSMPFAVLHRQIDESVAALDARVEVRCAVADGPSVPAGAADAIASATLQAVVNSVQHAGDGPVSRSVRLGTDTDGRVHVEVVDDGVGFDRSAVPAERLGVRRSIIERMAAVDGAAEVLSAPGDGTRVMLVWPALVRRSAPRHDEPVDVVAAGPAEPSVDGGAR
jgi:signal transduction histidine kinase